MQNDQNAWTALVRNHISGLHTASEGGGDDVPDLIGALRVSQVGQQQPRGPLLDKRGPHP